ncbi:MAG: hypothetical protein GX892_04155 [Thermoanaerobacteraceae bacterium]|nr:hypothetical protein [Bacillota bacterium]NLZ52333.1 hypothetical protein [Thermoanaerobacteraceae bacterium]
MKESEIKGKIRTAVTHSVPDVLEAILSDCEKQKGNVIQMRAKNTRKQNWFNSLRALAAVFVLIVISTTGYSIYGARMVDAIVSFDVNPSLELKVNKNEKVLAATPLNEEGQLVIGNMDFKNIDLEVAVNALIGSMLKNGYINELENTILISVENKDAARGAALQAKLREEVSSLLRASSIEGAILSQSVSDDERIKVLAEANAITRGRAQVISQLVELDPSYDFEELNKLTINELNLLIGAKQLELANISSVGKASDKAYIGIEKAVEIALNHAKVDASAARDLETELDSDDGKLVYEIEFYANGREYEYEIDALSGEILSFEIEKDDDYQAAPSQPSQPSIAPIETEQPATSRMSAAEAREAVLKKFGGIIQKIEYNYDEKNPLYKGEALKDGYKVVFELNARTNSFKKWDVENDNSWDKFSQALPNLITMEQAANSVVEKSGKPNTFVQKIDFLWDDSEPIYQGEAFNRGVKYSFEIKADSGEFQKWDASTGDETWSEKYFNVR